MTSQTLDRPWPTPRLIQRPVRAVGSGAGVWLIWVTVVVLAFELLPTDTGSSAVFVAMTWVALAILVAATATAYLRRVSMSSAREGLLIGLLWVASFIILDLVHYALMHPALLDGYWSQSVPPYLVVPALTTVLLGGLRAR